jgi:hypothetical protein
MVNIRMHDLVIFTKGLVVILFVWFTDLLMIQLSTLAFISADIRDFFSETKDIINWLVSISVLYATYLRIKKEKSKK